MTFITYEKTKATLPTTAQHNTFIERSRHVVQGILSGADPRLLLIVGPCSIHDPVSAKEFGLRLKELAQQVSQSFYILMRVYCEKPRSSSGWKGMLYDPYLDGSHHLEEGISRTRRLMLDLLDLGVPIATEFLDPMTAYYYEDLVTWGSIGARTSSSQIHRQFASGLKMPIGFKNGVAGNISAAVHGVLSASQPHIFLGIKEDGRMGIIRTEGNAHGHIVLRGGESQPNYHPEHISDAIALLAETGLPSRLLVDCSHHNSRKQAEKQSAVFHSVLHQFKEDNAAIRGLMLESHLFGGAQKLSNPNSLSYGISITDACLDWETTASLVSWGALFLNQKQTMALRN